jgi:hypothetical protein
MSRKQPQARAPKVSLKIVLLGEGDGAVLWMLPIIKQCCVRGKMTLHLTTMKVGSNIACGEWYCRVCVQYSRRHSKKGSRLTEVHSNYG